MVWIVLSDLTLWALRLVAYYAVTGFAVWVSMTCLEVTGGAVNTLLKWMYIVYWFRWAYVLVVLNI